MWNFSVRKITLKTRDYTRIDKYLDRLTKDVYPQPEDAGHTALSEECIETFVSQVDMSSVLDVGAGEGFCQDIFNRHGITYAGVAVGEDVRVARSKGRQVIEADFSFLSSRDKSYDMVFSRHSLEHSPFPLITLMEWKRVARKYIAIVVPAPEHWKYRGRNHYFVLNRRQWKNLFETLGMNVIYENVKRQHMSPTQDGTDVAIEYWYLLEIK